MTDVDALNDGRLTAARPPEAVNEDLIGPGAAGRDPGPRVPASLAGIGSLLMPAAGVVVSAVMPGSGGHRIAEPKALPFGDAPKRTIRERKSRQGHPLAHAR